jgi:hypothetical protein
MLARQIVSNPRNYGPPDDWLPPNMIDEQVRIQYEADAESFMREAIREARQINPASKWRKIEEASIFLRDIREAVAPPKEPSRPGRPSQPTAERNRYMLCIMHHLAEGKTQKYSVAAACQSVGHVEAEKRWRAASVEIDRFCTDIHSTLAEAMPQADAEGFLNPGTIDLVSDDAIHLAFRKWPGAIFPKDIVAFREALKRRRPSSDSSTR